MAGGELDTEERANRSQINKGNRFRKDWCNRLKSLKVTPTTPEGAYSRNVSWKKELFEIELNLH